MYYSGFFWLLLPAWERTEELYEREKEEGEGEGRPVPIAIATSFCPPPPLRKKEIHTRTHSLLLILLLLFHASLPTPARPTHVAEAHVVELRSS